MEESSRSTRNSLRLLCDWERKLYTQSIRFELFFYRWWIWTDQVVSQSLGLMCGGWAGWRIMSTAMSEKRIYSILRWCNDRPWEHHYHVLTKCLVYQIKSQAIKFIPRFSDLSLWLGKERTKLGFLSNFQGRVISGTLYRFQDLREFIGK